MSNQPLVPCYHEFVSLTANVRAAIDRRDIDEIFRLDIEVTRLMAEIERISRVLDPPSTAPKTKGASPPLTGGSLEGLIRQAMDQVDQNSDQIRRWLEETGADLVRLQRGAAAVQRYSNSGRTGSLLFEQEV